MLAAATACSGSSSGSSSTSPAAASAPAGDPQQSTGAPAAAGGLPPEPDAATAARYIAALNAIDPDIVHGKEDTAVSRGRDECSSIGQGKADDELVKLALQRFTSPTHPQGFGPGAAVRILDAVRTHLCPAP
ncbi:hypothetical protein HUT16_25395 [Kitasatospora sp. NA04385]|nr:hypothetical protein HUT16_25395 [Kitasatospora sp. NA04385]